MTGTRGLVVRGGLAFFAVVSGVLGTWILVSPEGFFSFPWVNLGMPYNPHLMLDYGAMNLAAAIPLAVAVISAPLVVRAALASYTVWTVAHLGIHWHLRAHLAAHTSEGQAGVLLAILTAGAVISLALLVLSLTGPRRE
ncbi:hypothetical protein ACFO5K_13355 [Nocardia halotolerans]|uniref:Uncharacterized protein n=1 Tax=Nocardia halotolerans TaxID=1755878 RepID=A0ABV8VJX9_9NOCA